MEKEIKLTALNGGGPDGRIDATPEKNKSALVVSTGQLAFGVSSFLARG
jgi:hypothetical protein